MHFFHKWKILGTKKINTYEKPSDKIPVLVETCVSQVCTKCGDVRIKTLVGVWTENGNGGKP